MRKQKTSEDRLEHRKDIESALTLQSESIQSLSEADVEQVYGAYSLQVERETHSAGSRDLVR